MLKWRHFAGLGSAALKCKLTMLMVTIAAVIGSISIATASYLNPTENTDCNMLSDAYPFRQRLDEIRTKSSQCWSDHWTGDLSMIRDNMECNTVNATMTNKGFVTCAPYEQQQCGLEQRIKQLRESCMAKLEAHKAREAEEKKRRELEEKRRRETERQAEILQNAAQRAASPSGLGPDFNTIRKFQSRAPTIARALMGNSVPQSGAHRLSQRITKYGTKYLQGLQAEAMGQLDQAWAGYSASNPRPSQSQMEARSAFVANSANAGFVRLPLAGQSAVLGAYSELLTTIVEGRASGAISEPIANIVSVAATAAAIATIVWKPPPAIEISSQISGEESQRIRKQRQASLSAAFGELNNIVRRRRESNTFASTKRPSSVGMKEKLHDSNKKASHLSCVEIIRKSHYRLGFITSVRNNCTFPVQFSCSTKDTIGNRLDPGIYSLGCKNSIFFVKKADTNAPTRSRQQRSQSNRDESLEREQKEPNTHQRWKPNSCWDRDPGGTSCGIE